MDVENGLELSIWSWKLKGKGVIIIKGDKKTLNDYSENHIYIIFKNNQLSRLVK
jgi:hypothetical protein